MPTLLLTLLPILGNVFKSLFPDKTEEEKQKFLLEMQTQLSQSQELQAQINVDAQEAASPNIFVAGWRPFIGWICGMAFAWQYFLQPLVTYIVVVSGHPFPNLPTFDYSVMMPVLMGMLGLGGLRTFEKFKQCD